LVYGEETKKLLCEKSIFRPEQVEVIGNPRIQMYKKLFSMEQAKRNLILFASQPYEQDGVGTHFYSNAIAYLQKLQNLLQTDPAWQGYRLGIKLHPRENNGVRELYEKALPGCAVYDNTSQLFELLNESFLQITATSTTLYEAALFDVPTVVLPYNNIDPVENYGFAVWTLDDEKIFENCTDKERYSAYLQYLKEKSKQF
jgi:CDP-glycerol glycerophosphotransferase (TagB/SpsB family)